MVSETVRLPEWVTHGGDGIIVWGCMAASGVDLLTFIDSTLYNVGHINIVKENLKRSEKHLNFEDYFWCMQDNDPKHTVQNVKLWLLYNSKNPLHSRPKSAEIQPIKHLWDLLERKILQQDIASKYMLKRVIITEWNNFSSDETSKVVRSVPKRLTEVLRCKGYPNS
ncbi:hypothetical protein AVEN_221627-1 [Araneus ventricosus]|uniref:Transposable element Tcb1 transposase n=1 Tax=Araneus ventricosus TaxID=182803 RepID=A0A4Y2MMC6_ARAVE|nr:hypothetical protein AVEN_221627-1 [Araneus ventricosus]